MIFSKRFSSRSEGMILMMGFHGANFIWIVCASIRYDLSIWKVLLNNLLPQCKTHLYTYIRVFTYFVKVALSHEMVITIFIFLEESAKMDITQMTKFIVLPLMCKCVLQRQPTNWILQGKNIISNKIVIILVLAWSNFLIN